MALGMLRTVYRVLIISPGKPSYDRFVNLMNALATQVPNIAMTFEAAEGATDPTLRALGFKNIRRLLYKETHNYVLLPKSDAGRRADRFLSAAVSRAKGTAGYDKMQERPYGDWQP